MRHHTLELKRKQKGGYRKNLNVGEFVGSAIMIIIGAYVLFEIIRYLSQTDPAFAQYGWYLFMAYLFGAAIFLKYALSQRKY